MWAAIVDPQALFGAMSGCQRLDPIGAHEYEGAFDIAIGEVRGDFQGTLELADLQPPSSLRFSLNAMGAAGFIDGSGLMVLEDAGGGTRIHYDLDAKIGGKIATVGQRGLEQAARDLARKALNGLGNAPAGKPAPQPAVATEPEASTTAEKPTEKESRPQEPAVGSRQSGLFSQASAPELVAASSETAAPTAPDGDPETPRGGQYGSRASRDWPERLGTMLRKPELVGAALVLYTLVVVLLTRACS